MTAEPARRRFNVDDYYEMARAGILGEDDRVELIEGEIIEMPLYAASNIPEYWLVDLIEEAVTVYRQPQQLQYGSVRVLRRGETVVPVTLPEVEIGVDDILG